MHITVVPIFIKRMKNNLRCNYCDKEFKYESEKKRHELSHSSHFKCGVCNKEFSFNSALKRHEKQHQRTEKALCKQCGHSFRDESLLKRHLKYAHKGKYICKKCKAEFHSEVALSVHEKIHKPKAERKYHCSFDGCDKTFNFPHHLKHHELTHTNTKQHFCRICKKGFIQFHHLKTHMKKHEPEKWLHCTEVNCKKKFTTEYSKKRHLLHVHNLKLKDISTVKSEKTDYGSKYDDTVLCTTCGKVMDQHLQEEHYSKCTSCMSSKENSTELSCVEEQPLQCTEINTDADTPQINDCKSALGSCIVGDLSETCLCAQIKTTVDDYYDNGIITNQNFTGMNVEPDLQLREPDKTIDNGSINAACKSCACGDNDTVCSATNQQRRDRKCQRTDSIINLPDIEYKLDGSIKLKDTFDLDINVFENANSETKEKAELYSSYNVPFNSCKAVLGKCIVSGNGTISEECLCARMLVDEHQVTPEEIDEITPHPTVSTIDLSVI